MSEARWTTKLPNRDMKATIYGPKLGCYMAVLYCLLETWSCSLEVKGHGEKVPIKAPELLETRI